ncbi:MAG TPA: hypothetical protein GX010_04950 [Erysipelotrichaceae bacterium]|nr:hypothetical protein [Erysipelotrichaceae bacterium]
MKKLSKLVAATVIASSVIGLTSTLAWLIPIAKFSSSDAPIDAITEGAYYAYGEGTVDNPFGISKPRHLYNLSWLHFLGNYDDGQYYFELDPELENGVLSMEGWTIPPIGTEDHPFIGNFNGNGNVIDGCSISNDFSDFDAYPGTMTAAKFNGATGDQYPKVVGFFGVVGDLNNNIAYGAYDSQINEFKNTGLLNITVTSIAPATLVGAAVGYSDGVISNVAVDTPTLNIEQANAVAYDFSLTNNISDYGIVGYTENKSEISKIDSQLYGVNVSSGHEYSAAAEGDAQGWGGSINMKTIFERMYAIKMYATTTVSNFAYHQTKYYYNGTENVGEQVNRTTSSLLNYNKDYVGNFNFFNRNTATDLYNYLVGGHYQKRNYYTYVHNEGYYITDGTNYLTYSNGQLINSTSTDTAGIWVFEQVSNYYYIYTYSDNQTTKYYLYYDNGSLGIINSTGTTRQWTVTQSGSDLTIEYNSKKIYFYNNIWQLIPVANGYAQVKVVFHNNNYIANNGSSGNTPPATTSSASAAIFEVDSSNRVYTIVGTTTLYLALYYQNYFNRSIRLINSPSANRYYNFTYSGGVLSSNYNGTNYYLRYNSGWTYTTSTSYVTDFTLIDDLSQPIDYSGYKLNNTLASSAVERDGPSAYQTSSDLTQGANESRMYYTAQDTTYFPLNVENDGGSFSSAAALNTAINNGNFDPKESNTGYIISGSKITDGTTSYTKDESTIRISKYSFGNISGSISSGDTYEQFLDSKIYTIDLNNTRRTMGDVYSENDYPRYMDSKNAFYYNALTNGTNGSTNDYVFGLHFMDSTISMNNIVNASKVSVLGVEHDNYELPVESIDFNLKQKGKVNFFAGTYFPGNTSFFSLHEVERNGPTITAIKEIEEIYSNDVGSKTTKYSNIFKFKDGTYSKPYRFDGNQNKYEMDKYNTGDLQTPYVEYSIMDQTDFNAYASTYNYTLRFKTSQIGYSSTISTNSLYYFEFPMNCGEYCLGSVPTVDGCYLCYLDIGANAAKTQRTIFYEHFQEIKRTFEYPLGVAIVKADSVSSSTVDPTDTANVVIYAGYQGALTITRDSVLNTVTLTRATGMTNNAKPTLIGDLMWDDTYELYNIHDPGNNNLTSEIVCEEVIADTRRVQFYDYNVNLEEVMITIITDTSTDGTNYTRTLYQEIVGGASYDDTQADQMNIFNHLTGTKYSVEEARNQSTILSYDSAAGINNNLMIRLYYVTPEGITVTMVINLEEAVDLNQTTGQYYVFDHYLLEITVDAGSITIIVLESDSTVGTVMIGNTIIDENSEPIVIEYVAP